MKESNERISAGGSGYLRAVALDGFWIDRREVANAQLARLCGVCHAGWLGEAVQSLALVVFNWRFPTGPGSRIRDHMNQPVIHVAWEDASACERRADR